MIKHNDTIQYRNVVSQKLIIHSNQMEEAIHLVKRIIEEHDGTLTGRFFYTLEEILEETDLQIELFFEIEEDSLTLPESMNFHSYYCIYSMLSFYNYGGYQEETLLSYAVMYKYAEANQLTINTPFFHEVVTIGELKYIHLKVGVRPQTEEEIWA